MNTREAYVALLDGKKVRDGDGDVWTMDEDGVLSCSWGSDAILHDCAPFEIVETPATDEELVAEMKSRAVKSNALGHYARADVYDQCAKLLETRKVSP
jgi:hypothetical protein